MLALARGGVVLRYDGVVLCSSVMALYCAVLGRALVPPMSWTSCDAMRWRCGAVYGDEDAVITCGKGVIPR
eukprot:946407-Rhodomonas_salina.2